MIQGAAIAAPVAKGGVSVAASSTIPTLLTNSAGIAPGLTASSVLGGLSAYANPLMMGLSALQGINSYRQGQYQSSMAEVQQLQAVAESELKQVQAMEKGNETMRRLLAMNATVIANGAAGNIDPTSGSARKLQEVNEAYAARDLKKLEAYQRSYKTYGEVQSEMFALAGDEYTTQGTVGFLTGVGQATYFGMKYGV
jgi:hypothetical protein